MYNSNSKAFFEKDRVKVVDIKIRKQIRMHSLIKLKHDIVKTCFINEKCAWRTIF